VMDSSAILWLAATLLYGGIWLAWGRRAAGFAMLGTFTLAGLALAGFLAVGEWPEYLGRLAKTTVDRANKVDAAARDSEEDRACAAMSAAFMERVEIEWSREYSNRRVQSFYSPKVDSCIHVEATIIGNELEIRDLSHSILRDGGDRNLLLSCDSAGADSVVLDAVRSRGGLVYSVQYKEYLDDGFGGPPRTLKTPARPYTREDCERVLDKWMAILKS